MTTQSRRRPPLRLGWLSTGRGPGSRSLLSSVHEAIQGGELPATIAYVFCNRERGEAEGSDAFLQQVDSYGIPALTLSFRKFRREHGHDPDWRAAYNAELLRVLARHQADLLVLAGFLLILDESVVRSYPTLNLHPAAPGGPVGTWQEVVWELIERGAGETGVMTQLATADVDRGPIVTYCRFPLRGPRFDPLWEAIAGTSVPRLKEAEGEENALFQTIRREEVKREVPLLIATLRAIAEGRVRLDTGRVLDAAGRPVYGGHDLTEEIEALVDGDHPLSAPP